MEVLRQKCDQLKKVYGESFTGKYGWGGLPVRPSNYGLAEPADASCGSPQQATGALLRWADHGVEFFIHPAMRAKPMVGFPKFFRQDREGLPRGVIQVVRSES